MFQEEVADLTATHLRSHLEGYRTILQARYTDAAKLQLPKTVETNNLVGGVYNATTDRMPAYAVDIISKAFHSQSDEGLWLYSYDGHIAGVVSGGSEFAVNKLIKRHEQMVEMFVKDHEFMHSQESAISNDFRLRELGFSGAAFSGAELTEERDDRQVWMAGFRIDLLWVVSERGPYQHG